MKIHNAIILAAGRGSRMRELTDNKPKCMMQIDNKTVIQRTIEVLKYKNINNILVITGYNSNILRKHLKDIDNNIKIIHNPIWNITNSISSMRLAINDLKNTIVIDSDIYINNPDCIRNEVDFCGYSALRMSKSSEWQLQNDENNEFIEDVKMSGNHERALPIIDISYWIEEDSNVVAKRLIQITNHENDIIYNKFWDEIPLIDFRNELKLKRYDIEKTDAIEFDTPEELNELRRIVCLAD